MTLKVEHELHQRKAGKNVGVFLLLLAFIGIVFGLTVVKVLQLGEAQAFERFDHVARPAIVPDEGASE